MKDAFPNHLTSAATAVLSDDCSVGVKEGEAGSLVRAALMLETQCNDSVRERG